MKKPNDITAEKPREWWLHNTDSAGDVYKWGFCSGTFDPAIKSVHVIEYSAFSQTCEQLLGSHAELVELRSAYESVIEQLEQAKHTQQSAIDDLKEIIKERDALKAQLAEVTRERDKLKKALVGWGQDAQEVRTILAAEQIKAERYRAALEIYSRAICHSCAAEHGAPGQAFELPNLDNEFDSDDCRHDETDEYFIEMTCVANSRHKFRFRIFPDVGAELVDSTVEPK